jgi:hypothetical protein
LNPRFGDLIAIESRIVAVRKSSFEVEHRLTQFERALLEKEAKSGRNTSRL